MREGRGGGREGKGKVRERRGEEMEGKEKGRGKGGRGEEGPFAAFWTNRTLGSTALLVSKVRCTNDCTV